MSSDAPQTKSPALSVDERRLALLGVVDFEGDWDALEAAAALVVDGPAKAGLIRERLTPFAAQLSALFAEEIDVLELLAARHWFDTQTCQIATPPRVEGVVGDEAEAQETRA